MPFTDTSTAPRRVDRWLSDADRSHYFDNGFLVLPGFATADEVAAVNRAVDRVWDDKSIYNPVTISAYAGTPQYTETYIRNVDDRARGAGNKVNHLYLYDHQVLDILLSDKVLGVVADLIDGNPLLFNGLNLERGSEQRFHFDTFYMPPLAENRMAVLWFALEDIRPGSGELQYYPRSHTIPPYRFSHGEIWALGDEMPAFDQYIDAQIGDRGLKPERFRGASGDVFVWHAQLYHGGSAIEVPGSTRRSMIAHYWRAEDMPSEMCLEVRPGRFILDPRNMPVATNFDPTFTPAADTS
jgi:ectoine hydroxylase-related dioxygenase (phytanoyl-CoA dioxygenase family)